MLVLSPGRPFPALDANGDAGLIRSKRSNKFRKGHGVQGKSIFGEEDTKGKAKAVERIVPDELLTMRKKMRRELMERVSGAEWRVMGVDPVGSAAVQVNFPTTDEFHLTICSSCLSWRLRMAKLRSRDLCWIT